MQQDGPRVRLGRYPRLAKVQFSQEHCVALCLRKPGFPKLGLAAGNLLGPENHRFLAR